MRMLDKILKRLKLKKTETISVNFMGESRAGLNSDTSLFLSNNKIYQQYAIGKFSYGDPKVLSWGEGANLVIGSFCSFAKGVVILLGGEHRVDWVTTYPFSVVLDEGKSIKGHPKSKGDVVIGNDVWIGRDALILSGVKIGNGAVIGGRSLVVKDVAPYSIVGGNPAKHIRYRFSESQIKALEEIQWWNWPIDEIKKALPLLLSEKINDFITKYQSKSM